MSPRKLEMDERVLMIKMIYFILKEEIKDDAYEWS
jgi:hypothetical protein